MSEEKIVYEVENETVYKTYRDIYEEFMLKTGFPQNLVRHCEPHTQTGEIKIWLTDGSYIIYGN